MKPEITRSSWDDLIFESRNKEYGAYPIRKSHDESIAKGFFVALLFGAFLFGVVQVASFFHIQIKIPHPHLPTVSQFPPTIIAESPVKRIARREPNVNQDLKLRVVTHEIDPAPTSPIVANVPGPEPGPSNGGPVAGLDPGINVVEPPVVVAPPEVLIFAEVMPEYEGGLNAMSRFLSRKLNYPASARAMGLEGTVYVRFVVNSIGQVVDVEVVKGVSALLDTEAMRVVSLMTKWKPGKQHNISVNVRMVIPIKFQLER